MIPLKQEEVMAPDVVNATLKAIQFDDMPTDIKFKMTEYAKMLRKKYPKMKPNRLTQLVQRKFNLTLI